MASVVQLDAEKRLTALSKNVTRRFTVSTSRISNTERMRASLSKLAIVPCKPKAGCDQSGETPDVPLDEGDYDDDEGDGLENV